MNRWADVEAAAVAAGVSVRTIYRWIADGLLHPAAGMVNLDEIDTVRAKRRRVDLAQRLTRWHNQ